MNGNSADGAISISPGMKEYFDVAYLRELQSEKKLVLCYFNQDKPNIIPHAMNILCTFLYLAMNLKNRTSLNFR